MHLQVTLSATLEAVSQFSARLEDELASQPIETRTTVVLAVQELLVNIVEHAYGSASGIIDVEIAATGGALTVTVQDDAPSAFTMPDEVTAPDPLELPESGMGLFIIQQTFDEVQHIRLAPGSRWTLKKTPGDTHDDHDNSGSG